ncbi:MAG: hypothetical protein ACI3Y0_04860 [Prevotella sp.]
MAKKEENKVARLLITKIAGVALPHTDKYFQFIPDEPVPNQVQGYRRRGVATMLDDGKFGFCPTPYIKPKSQKLKRSAHGTLSVNEDSFYLTVRIDKEEGIDWRKQMKKEAIELLEE